MAIASVLTNTNMKPSGVGLKNRECCWKILPVKKRLKLRIVIVWDDSLLLPLDPSVTNLSAGLPQ